MSAISDDPLRFLKPRKKQFHLTPTKPAKQSPTYQNTKQIQNKQQQQYGINKSNNDKINNNKAQQISNLLTENSYITQPAVVNNNNNEYVLSTVMSNTRNININNSNKLRNNNNNNNKLYKVSKYFSLQIQNYLRQKSSLPLIPNDISHNSTKRQQQQKQYQYQQKLFQKQQQHQIKQSSKTTIQNDHSLQLQYQQQSYLTSNEFIKQVDSIRIKHQEQQENIVTKMNNKNQKLLKSYQQIQPQSVTSILMLQTKHDNKFRYQEKQKLSKQDQLSQNKPTTTNKTYNPFIVMKKEQSYPEQRIKHKTYQQHYEQQQQSNYQNQQKQQKQQQLKQCPICSRKFNPNSYQKHIKVCQKVFYKKRKQFSSQKQRSLSNKRK